MDYDEMISTLEGYFEGKDLKHGDALKIADGIKTLLAERNAAVEDMKGICSFCAHKKTCQFGNHLRDICVNGSNWQWCGPQKYD